MKRVISIWLLTFLVTVGFLVWQKMSGPTYPSRGSVDVGTGEFPVELLRTHSINGDLPVTVVTAAPGAPDPGVAGTVVWRRFPTDEPWQRLPMRYEQGALRAELPRQPMAGKLEYQRRAGPRRPYGPVPAGRGRGGPLQGRRAGADPGLPRHLHGAGHAVLDRRGAGRPDRRRRGPEGPGAHDVLLPVPGGLRAGAGGAEVRLRRLLDRLAPGRGLDRQQAGHRRPGLGVRRVAPPAMPRPASRGGASPWCWP